MSGSMILAAGAFLSLANGHAVDARASSYNECLNKITIACDEDGPEAAAIVLVRIAHENADGSFARERILRAVLLSGMSQEFPECER